MAYLNLQQSANMRGSVFQMMQQATNSDRNPANEQSYSEMLFWTNKRNRRKDAGQTKENQIGRKRKPGTEECTWVLNF